jgi:hypothetical protein
VLGVIGVAIWGADVMRSTVGAILLGLSVSGYPLTQFVIRRWGVRGAAVAESVCAGLAIRDAFIMTGGVPGGLRRVPAVLLRLELHVHQIWRRRAHSSDGRCLADEDCPRHRLGFLRRPVHR